MCTKPNLWHIVNPKIGFFASRVCEAQAAYGPPLRSLIKMKERQAILLIIRYQHMYTPCLCVFPLFLAIKQITPHPSPSRSIFGYLWLFSILTIHSLDTSFVVFFSIRHLKQSLDPYFFVLCFGGFIGGDHLAKLFITSFMTLLICNSIYSSS